MNNNDNSNQNPMAYVPNPFVIQQTSRGERSMDIYSRLLEDRIIYVGTEINSVTANLIIAQLFYLESSNPQKEIHMYINSPGGSIYDGLGIYDAMQHISCPVYTYCIGMAASMGSILFTAGQAGHRLMMPNARIMIHQPLGGQPQSQASDIEIRAKEIMGLKTRLYEIYEKHNAKGLKAADFIPLCDRDNFLSPEKAIELGLGDHIVRPKPKAKV